MFIVKNAVFILIPVIRTMSSTVAWFLKTEITGIPSHLQKIFGNYYDNVLSNAVSWLFIILLLLHYVFSSSLVRLLKKMKYKKFMCERLSYSLWNLGFYTTALAYCSTIIHHSAVLESWRPHFVPPKHSVTGNNFFIGPAVLMAFFMQSAFWEIIVYSNMISAVRYILLGFLMLFSYYMKITEITLCLILLVSVCEILTNLIRCCHTLMLHIDEELYPIKRYCLLILISFSVITTIGGYILVIPIAVLIPYGLKIATIKLSLLMHLNFLLVVGFLTVELYESILRRIIEHYYYHKDKNSCCYDWIECSVFPPRNDEEYIFKSEQRDMLRRKTVKKTSPKAQFLQTLKCAVALKRKIQEKRNLNRHNGTDEAHLEHENDTTDSENVKFSTEEINDEPLFTTAETIIVQRESVAMDNNRPLGTDTESEEVSSEIVEEDPELKTSENLLHKADPLVVPGASQSGIVDSLSTSINQQNERKPDVDDDKMNESEAL